MRLKITYAFVYYCGMCCMISGTVISSYLVIALGLFSWHRGCTCVYSLESVLGLGRVEGVTALVLFVYVDTDLSFL